MANIGIIGKEVETEHVLRFEFDDIDSKYGRVTGRVGEIPFLGSASKCITDAERLQASPRLNVIMGEIVSSYRDLWPQYTDDEIFEKLRDDVVATGVMYGCGDPEDPRFRFVAHLAAIGWSLDDVSDGDDESLAEKARKRREAEATDDATKWAKVKREYRLVQEVFRDQPVPTLDKFPAVSARYACFRDALAVFDRVARETIPDFEERYQHAYKDAMCRFVQSIILNWGVKAAGNRRWYRRAHADLFRTLSGVPCVNEMYGLIYGTVVEHRFRRDLLFTMLQETGSDIWTTVNSLLGLDKDLREDQTDNALFIDVLYNGKSLQAAVDDTYTRVLNTLADYRTLRAQLLDIFDDEPSVAEWVHNSDTFVNGALYFYALTNRYGIKHQLRVTSPSPGNAHAT